MIISDQLYCEIIHSFDPAPPENGGILGSIRGEVCAFCLDRAKIVTESNKYIPNVAFLNEVIERWSLRGIKFSGIVHTHVSDQGDLSSADKQYIRRIMSVTTDDDPLFFPIVLPGERMISYIACYGNGEMQIMPDKITVIKGE